MAQLIGYLTGQGFLTGTLSGTGALIGGLTVPEKILPEIYPGPYAVTPSEDTQMLSIEGMMASQDVTVNPIPSQYHDTSGATLTVGDVLLSGVTAWGANEIITGSALDGNNLEYGVASCLVGTAKVGTGYAWTSYQGDNVAIINQAVVGTDAVV